MCVAGGAGGAAGGAAGHSPLPFAGLSSSHGVHALLWPWRKFHILVGAGKGCLFPLKGFLSED